MLLALRPQVKIASNFITRIGDKLAKEDVEFPDLLANYVMIAIGCAIRVVIQDQNLLQGK